METTDLSEKRLVEDKSLYRSSGDGKHGQTAMLNLLLLGLGNLFWGFSSQKSTSPADITGLTSIVMTVEIGKLYTSNGGKDLKIDSHAYSGGGTEGVGVLVGLTGKVEVSLGDESYDGKHGNTSVLELGPASVGEVLLDFREAHGVESYISGHGSVKLFRDGHERKRFGHLSVEGDNSAGGRGSRGEGGSRADKGSDKNRTDHDEEMY